MKSPVLVLTFNRPDFLIELLDIVVEANPPKIYVAVDGPRESNAGDAQAHSAIKEIVRELSKKFPVISLIREKNLGCRDAVASAITWFFCHEPEGVILEDDCHPTSSFFNYCDDLLDRFRDDSQVVSIGGYRPLRKPKEGGMVSFSRYPQIWGWATWRRVWNNYDSGIEDWLQLRQTGWLRREVGLSRFAAIYWAKRFDSTFRGLIDTWDYQFTFLAMQHHGLSVVPPVNLVVNIGFDSRSTHTGPKVSKRVNQVVSEMQTLLVPVDKSSDRRLDRSIEKRSHRVFTSVILGPLRDFVAKWGISAIGRTVKSIAKGKIAS